MPAGRPTDYQGEETIRLAEEYFTTCVDDKINTSVNLPKAVGLALYLDVSRDTLYEWAEKYPEFSYILQKLNKLQEQKLINEGLSGFYNSSIAKLVLGKHGYHETQEVTSKHIFSKEDDNKAREAIKDITG